MKKKTAWKVCVPVLLLMLLGSCGKYEEGPTFSLASKKSRVQGHWMLDGIIIDGEEQEMDDTYRSRRIQFDKNGSAKFYEIQEPDEAIQGSWKFTDGKGSIEVSLGIINPTVYTYEILRLKSDELWWVYTSDDIVIEEHYRTE